MANPKKKLKLSDDGHRDMQAILAQLREMSDKIADLEDKVADHHAAGEAMLQMVNAFYNTDDTHILELSHISPLASRPFAEALTLDAITDPDVQSGKVSLNKLLILNYLRFQRSVRGRHFALGMPALQEQISAATKEEFPEELEAGEE